MQQQLSRLRVCSQPGDESAALILQGTKMPMGACALKDPENRVLAKPALKSDTKLKAGILSSAGGTNSLPSLLGEGVWT